MEQELGARLPEGIEVRAVEETADTVCLVIPSASPAGGEAGELSDDELASVAGGAGTMTWSDDPCSIPDTGSPDRCVHSD